jgi:hypothetical protein
MPSVSEGQEKGYGRQKIDRIERMANDLARSTAISEFAKRRQWMMGRWVRATTIWK